MYIHIHSLSLSLTHTHTHTHKHSKTLLNSTLMDQIKSPDFRGFWFKGFLR